MRIYERLSELYFLHFPVCLRLPDTQSFHQPAVLLRSNTERLILTTRPLELTLFKPLVEQKKAFGSSSERLDDLYQGISLLFSEAELIEDIDEKPAETTVKEHTRKKKTGCFDKLPEMCPPRKNRQKTQAKKRMKRMTSMI